MGFFLCYARCFFIIHVVDICVSYFVRICSFMSFLKQNEHTHLFIFYEVLIPQY